MNSPLFSPEDVADLGMALRVAGYSVGPDQCIAAQRLIVTLAAEGVRFSDRRTLQTWLAPIFCSSPSEQTDFANHFDQWLTLRGEPVPRQKSTAAGGGWVSPGTRSQGQTSRSRQAIATLVIVVAVLGASFWAYSINDELINRTVRGQVVDQNNVPLPGPVVRFRGKTIQTDPNSGFILNFRLIELPAEVTAQKEGFNDSIHLDARNCTAPVTLHLGPQEVVTRPPPDNPSRLDLTADEVTFLRQTPYVKGSTSPDDTTPLTLWQRIYQRHYWDLFAAAVSIPLLLMGLWILWVHLPRLQLIRWKSEEGIQLNALRVQGFGTEFFASPGFRRIAQQLRRHRLVESSDLDADRTVAASAARGGWFTPVYLWRKRLPDYLILIDRAGFRDFQGRLIDDLVKNLRLGRVEVDCYDFYSDPRVCYLNAVTESPTEGRRRQQRVEPAKTGVSASSHSSTVSVFEEERPAPRATLSQRFSLEDLLAKHPNHNLFIISDGSGFFSPLSGTLQPWIDQFSPWTFRVFLVPERMVAANSDRRTRVLEESGFLILSATEKGLSTAVEVLDSGGAERGNSVRPAELDPGDAYPSLLNGEDLRWLSDLPPRPTQVSLLIGQLRAYLGQETFAWLCACAVYPELLWDLTLYLGNELGIVGPDEQRLALLLRLPWFRHARMPDWLRERLANVMAPTEREAVRDALWRLLQTALERPLDGFELPYASDAKAKPKSAHFRTQWLRRLLANFLRTEPPQSALRDYVFLSVLHGRKTGKGLPVPDRLRRLWGRFGQPRRPFVQVAAGVLAAAAVAGPLYHYRPKPPNPGSGRVQPLPVPTGPAPYHLALDNVISSDAIKSVQDTGTLVFQTAGDTGGIGDPVPQEAVAAAMTAQYQTSNLQERPSFLYLLGNLTYYDGAASNYYNQFYLPYRYLPAPIFAIPGNSDGTPSQGQTSLDAFVRNFCSSRPVDTPEAKDMTRTSMTEPNPYWTLDTPFATIIGLYTNVVTGGFVDAAQQSWLVSELKTAPANKALVVAMHNPIYSLSSTSQGTISTYDDSNYLGSVLDRAMLQAGRAPDLVLAAHGNNYQRFSRQLGPSGRIIPYVISANGGYPNLQRLLASAKLKIRSDVIMESFDSTQYGFLRVTVTSSKFKTEYFAVAEPGTGAPKEATLFDTWTFDLSAPQTPASHPLEGLYQAANGNVLPYLRFYRDGTVLAATSTGTPADIDKWFQKTNKKGIFASGSYTADKSSLSFSTAIASGTGKIVGNTLQLDLNIPANVYRGPQVYRLVQPVGSTQNQATESPTASNPVEPPNSQSVEARGFVRSQDGKPVSNVAVRINESASKFFATSTSETGEFRIPLTGSWSPGDSVQFEIPAWKILSPAGGKTFLPKNASETITLIVSLPAAGNAAPPQDQNRPEQQLPSLASERMIFDNWNTEGVESGPRKPTTFTITQAYYITHIWNYHWNGGRGAPPQNGNISLRGSNVTNYAAWLVTASSGQDGAANVSWGCTPNLTIPAGTYEVVDSDPATWSHNSASGNSGFSRVQGYPVDNQKQAPSATTQANGPPFTTPVQNQTSAASTQTEFGAVVSKNPEGRHSVDLAWTPSKQTQGVVTRLFNIYRSTTSRGPYAKIGSSADPKFHDTNVSSGTTYYYVVTAVSQDGAESSYSSEVMAAIP
jgi:hypothetical protein